MLTTWFQLNQTDMEARQYLYPDIPHFYVFNENTKTWAMREKIGNQYLVGCIL